MKNANSIRPDDELIEFLIYSSSGVLKEEGQPYIFFKNTMLGSLDYRMNRLLPEFFTLGEEVKYILTVKMDNFETGMAFTLYLNDGIEFSEDDPNCSIISGK